MWDKTIWRVYEKRWTVEPIKDKEAKMDFRAIEEMGWSVVIKSDTLVVALAYASYDPWWFIYKKRS